MEDTQKLKDMLNAEKQEFLAVMSHELRTPMTGVKGYLSMVLDGDAGKISAEVKDCVTSAYAANDRLIRLVDDMIKAVTIQEGKTKFNIIKINLTEKLGIIIKSFYDAAKNKKIALYYERPTDDVFVNADQDQIQEIFENIISNAIKFTHEGKVVVSFRFRKHWAIVDVADSGIGIKKEDQDRLFDIFTKANLKLASQEKGTGLGLYISRKLAEAQGGNVWLEHSEANSGSIFSIALPITK